MTTRGQHVVVRERVGRTPARAALGSGSALEGASRPTTPEGMTR